LTGDGPLPTPDSPVVISNAAIQGVVVNAASGAPVLGASVVFDTTTLTSDADGRYEQASSGTTGRIVFEGSATGYEPLFSPAEVLGSVPSVSLLRLTPFGATSDITVTAGGTVTDSSTSASVTVPPNALTGIGGAPTPATVSIRLTSIAVGSGARLLSGDYTDDNGGFVESFGGANVTATTAADVATGQELTLRIPLSTRSAAAPALATLYLLDPITGLWVQQGPATLSAGAYTGAITAFGQWMVGAPIATPATVTGCVEEDTGAPAANVRVQADGIDYSAVAYATTNAQGQFTINARPSGRVVVSGQRGAYLTNAASVGPTNLNVTPCLTIPTANAATMTLTWGLLPRDIDSHLRTPDGSHVYYVSQGSLIAAPFSSLDVDDVDGQGPEITTVRRPRVGIYRFYLHNFSGTFNPGMTGSPVRLELNYAGRPVVFSPPPGEGSARYWHLFDLYIAPDCTMTLYRYNRWRADEPQNPNAATTFTTATECVPS
jgi:hypothetical protein